MEVALSGVQQSQSVVDTGTLQPVEVTFPTLTQRFLGINVL
jgi:hypothetical protein